MTAVDIERGAILVGATLVLNSEHLMTTHKFTVSKDDQVFLEEGGEEIGAVRAVNPDHLVVYVENAKDFIVPGEAVLASHDGKVVLDPAKVGAALLQAARKAHVRETE
jgi:hypothetical protein